MHTITDLPMLRLPVPPTLAWKGAYVDNGPLSNFSDGEAVIRYRSIASRKVEPAYVAAKAPDALVRHPLDPSHEAVPFHVRVAAADPARVKRLGAPRSRGGLIDLRPDWENVCVAAMACFLAQKFAAGTREARWLVEQPPPSLVEFLNWHDSRWGCAFARGEDHAIGRNALGLLLVIGRQRLIAGRTLPIATEAEWPALQLALLPAMARLSGILWPGQSS